MSDGGYWIDSPDNPFNQMSYTRGGGGYDNEQTHASNAARAFAMQGSGTGALPRYADTATAQSVLPAGSLAVVGEYVVRTTAQTARSGSASSLAFMGSGAGAGTAATGTAATGTAQTSGAGAAQVASVPTPVKSKGAGSKLTVSAGPEETTDLFVGGNKLPKDEGTSDGADFEDRWGEVGGAIMGLGTMVIDLTKGVTDAAAQRASEYREKHGLSDALVGGGGYAAIMDAWANMQTVNGSARLNSDGVVVRTGGGF